MTNMTHYTFFLPVASSNVAHYFAKGCICPTSLIEKERNADIQTKYGEQAICILTEKKFIDKNYCIIEIFVTEEEKNDKNLFNNVKKNKKLIFINGVLPISRVKTVWFKSKEQAIITQNSMQVGDGFLPNYMIQVDENIPNISISEFSSVSDKKNTTKELMEKNNYFNQLMGGFALTKSHNISYDSYAAAINIKLGKSHSKLDDIKKILKKEKIEQEKDFSFCFNKVKPSDLKNVKKSFIGLYNLDSINELNDFLRALILTYGGEGSRKTLDNFINDFNSDYIENPLWKKSLFFFGINKGYEIFRNQYHLPDKTVKVKFQLDKMSDLYIIESIYQLAFHGNIDNSSFPYLDEVFKDKVENDLPETQEITKPIIIEEQDEQLLSKLCEKYGIERLIEFLQEKKNVSTSSLSDSSKDSSDNNQSESSISEETLYQVPADAQPAEVVGTQSTEENTVENSTSQNENLSTDTVLPENQLADGGQSKTSEVDNALPETPTSEEIKEETNESSKIAEDVSKTDTTEDSIAPELKAEEANPINQQSANIDSQNSAPNKRKVSDPNPKQGNLFK
jgi:hypothetical protein